MSRIRLIPFSIFSTFRKAMAISPENFNSSLLFYVLSLIVVLMWVNALANRIRDYGSNPWIAVFSLIPLANIGLALYYGIVQHKKKPVSDNATDNSDTSLAKAVYNHTKDIAIEVKPTIDDYKQKHATSQIPVQSEDINEAPAKDTDLLNDDAIYEQVMLEIEEDKKVKATWARALAQSDGNKDRAEALYIQFRIDTIKTELETEKLRMAKEDEEQNRLVCEEIEKKLLVFLDKNHLELNKKISDTKIKANEIGSIYDIYAEYEGVDWHIVNNVLYADH